MRWQLGQIKLEGETLYLDSSIMERYGKQEGAWLGYNPKKHRRPSHHPLIATLGLRPWAVHAWLRSGNTTSARGAEAFLEEALALLPEGTVIRQLRADSGFGIAVSEVMFQAQGWTRARRVVVVHQHAKERDFVRGRELFDNPAYLYQAILTNREDAPEEVWRFYRKHAEVESRIRELKWDYGIDGFCQKKFFPTEAAFRLVCVTYNLVSLLQEKLGKKVYQTLGTLRGQLLACGAVVGRDSRRFSRRKKPTAVQLEQDSEGRETGGRYRGKNQPKPAGQKSPALPDGRRRPTELFRLVRRKCGGFYFGISETYGPKPGRTSNICFLRPDFP